MFIPKKMKIRIWDKETEEMWMDVLMDMSDNDMYDDDASMWNIAKAIESGDTERFIWMLFANVHDVENTEIYEGDIVKNDKTGVTFVVKDMRMFFQTEYDGKQSDDLEIIGNIFENPKLIPLQK